jgi:hypothetical protein
MRIRGSLLDLHRRNRFQRRLNTHRAEAVQLASGSLANRLLLGNGSDEAEERARLRIASPAQNRHCSLQVSFRRLGNQPPLLRRIPGQ